MSERSVVCESCNTRYRLPDGFAASRVKCRKCGTVIEVEPAPAAPPSAPPRASMSAASPASAAHSRRRSSSRDSRESRLASRGRRGSGVHRRAAEGRGDAGRSLRGEKKVPVLYYVSAGGLFIALLLGVVLITQLTAKKEREAETERVKAEIAATPPASVITPSPEEGQRIIEAERQRKEEDEKKVLEAVPVAKKRPVYKSQPLGHLPGTSPAQQAEIEELIATLINLDLTRESNRARERLVEIGEPAIPRLLNMLHQLKLDDEADVMRGNLINTTLRNLAPEQWEKVGYSPQGVDPESVKLRRNAVERWFRWWMPIDEARREAASGQSAGS